MHLRASHSARTKTALVWLVLIVVTTAMAAWPASAQSGATVAVTVRDQTGGVVPAATLVLTATNVKGEQQATGNAQGDVVFRLVAAGVYDLAASKAGFSPSILRGIVVRDGDHLSLVITLRIGELSEAVSVTGLGVYRTVESTSATKTNTPLLETPTSIQVMPRAVIEDQKLVRLKEVLENVSGVQPQPSLGLNNTYIIRGFENRNRTYRNGLGIVGGSAFGSFDNMFDTANLESVEVLKGPASVLYGRNEPGGLINLNTKRPLAAPSYSVEQRVGSYDAYRTEWDATGPMGDSTLLYRFVGAFQDSGSFRDFGATDRVLVNPSVSWRPSHATEFAIDVEWLTQDHKADFGLPALGNSPADLPISRSLDDPNTPLSESSHVIIGAHLVHRLGRHLTLNGRFLTTHADSTSTFINPAPAFGNPLRPDGRTLDRNIFSQDLGTEAYAANIDLVTNVRAGSTRHEILTGFDYTLGHTDYGSTGDYENPNPALAIDIFNPSPSYGIPQSLFESTLATSVDPATRYSVARVEWSGLYLQDHITIGERWHILGGGRYDWADRGRGFDPESYDSAEAKIPGVTRKDREFSPRAGIVYEVLPSLSTYGSWSTSFGANNGISASGDAQPPEKGRQYEVGLKAEGLGRRLSATMAVYHLTKENVLTADLSTPDPFDSAAIGESRSRGVEVDAVGQLAAGTSLIASYALTDAEVTKDNSSNVGHRLTNVARHLGSVWLKHELRRIEGVSVGAGVYFSSDRTGDLEDTFRLPAYGRVDALASYRWRVGTSTLTVQLNVRNLFDTVYYESTDQGNVSSRFGVYPGAPFTATGSFRVQF